MIRFAVSIGCPCGIGPEVSVMAASRLGREVRGSRAVLVGDLGAILAAAAVTGVAAKRIVRVDAVEEAWALASSAIAVFEPIAPLAARDRRWGKPGRAAGAAQLAWIDAATDLVSSGAADALVTGPVSKEAIARSEAEGSKGFLGHTEHLAARLGAKEVTMAFYAPRGSRKRASERSEGAVERKTEITTSLVTTHLPLARVPGAVIATAVARACYWTADFVSRVHDTNKRVAIAALNPHAGEGGLLGDEEEVAITPGIERARLRLTRDRIKIALEGPIPAESAFRHAANGTYGAVVAMYHDQATIPMKLLGFGDAVNVSLGLPIIRTSVDHGTAYDRAGKGTSDPGGMIEAIRLAARLTGKRTGA